MDEAAVKSQSEVEVEELQRDDECVPDAEKPANVKVSKILVFFQNVNF